MKPVYYGRGTECDDSTRCYECSMGYCELHDTSKMRPIHNNFVSYMLNQLALYCEEQANRDENLVVQEYHDQWMAARTEIRRCAETIRKGGE